MQIIIIDGISQVMKKYSQTFVKSKIITETLKEAYRLFLLEYNHVKQIECPDARIRDAFG